MMDAYAASKAGVAGLTKSLAPGCGQLGIRVNAICPGYVDTPMNALIFGSDEFRDAFASDHAMGLQPPEEIAELVVFLASDEAVEPDRRRPRLRPRLDGVQAARRDRRVSRRTPAGLSRRSGSAGPSACRGLATDAPSSPTSDPHEERRLQDDGTVLVVVSPALRLVGQVERLATRQRCGRSRRVRTARAGAGRRRPGRCAAW